MKRTFSVTLIIFVILGLLATGTYMVKAEPKIITVPDEYPSIQAAINNATEGDTVFVKNGTYNEAFSINKSISLVAENTELTVINLPASTSITINANNVTLSGFTISAGNVPTPSISVFPFEKTLTAIKLQNALYCNITGNRIVNSGTAIWLYASSNNIIELNEIESNYYGLDLADSSRNNTISGNNIDSNKIGIRFYDRSNAFNLVNANNITYCETGLFFYHSNQNAIVGNTISHSIHQAISFVDSLNNIFHHNNFISNQKQLSEDPATGNFLMSYSINVWDDGKEGNYWSDYNDAGTNSTTNAPYIIDKNNQDNHPLAQPVTIQDYMLYSHAQLTYPSPTPRPSASPSPTPEPTLTLSPTPDFTLSPNPTPTGSPSPSPSPLATATSQPAGEGGYLPFSPIDYIILIGTPIAGTILLAYLLVRRRKLEQAE